MIYSNEPAYPTVSAGVHLPHHGMTIRAAMAKDFMSDYIAHLSRNDYVISACYQEAASEACQMADILIAELNKPQS